MKRIRVIMLVLIFHVLAGCYPENIDNMRQDLYDQGARLDALEAWQEQMNTNVATLQALLDAQQQGKMEMTEKMVLQSFRF